MVSVIRGLFVIVCSLWGFWRCLYFVGFVGGGLCCWIFYDRYFAWFVRLVGSVCLRGFLLIWILGCCYIMIYIFCLDGGMVVFV